MNPLRRTFRIAVLTTFGLVIAACSSSSTSSESSVVTEPAITAAPTTTEQTTTTLAPDSSACVDPPKNPYLADSGAPIGHIDSAQSNGSPIVGPRDSTKTLASTDLQYADLGPGHRLPHRRGGTGQGVGQQVRDEGSHRAGQSWASISAYPPKIASAPVPRTSIEMPSASVCSSQAGSNWPIRAPEPRKVAW